MVKIILMIGALVMLWPSNATAQLLSPVTFWKATPAAQGASGSMQWTLTGLGSGLPPVIASN